MRKLGIVTFWGVPNYGTFLQAYALKRTLEMLYPMDDVQLIPYLHERHYNQYYNLNTKSDVSMEKMFIENYYILSGEERISAEELKKRKYDVLFFGSDIIWDYTIGFFGNDKFLFGDNLVSEKKIAYAASFGTAKINDILPNYVSSSLLKYDKISVRDNKSADIVEKLTLKRPHIMPDPTFLWNFNEDKAFEYRNKYGDYILVYGDTFSQEMIEEAVEFSNTNNLKTICAGTTEKEYCSWCDLNIPTNEITPYEMVSMFKYAKIVMTYTFHGLMLGLIFNKRIAFYPTSFILNKLSSVIEDFNLNEPLLNSQGFYEKINCSRWDCIEDFVVVKENYKKKGLDFLRGL